MVRNGLKAGLLGMLAVSMLGCSATPPTQTAGTTPAESATAPVVDLPMQASEQDLVAPEQMKGGYDTQQFAFHRGRRYRFRRVIIASVPYYVPYYYPTTYPYYVPYYNYYDPYYYYTPAYYSPYFGSRFITIRIRRHGRRW